MKVSKFLGAGRPRAGLRKLACLALPLAATALAVPLPAHAQDAQMLFLSTAESKPAARTMVDNAWAAFEAQAKAAGLAPVDGRGLLSGTASVSGDIANARFVVVVSAYNTVAYDRMLELDTALHDPNLAIAAFIDEGESPKGNTNADIFLRLVGTWARLPWLDLVPRVNGNYVANLNADSAYQDPFAAAGLNTLTANGYRPIVGAPSDYVLYSTYSPSVKSVNDVALLIPRDSQNACLFFTADSNAFDNGGHPQYDALASALTTALLDPAGACAKPDEPGGGGDDGKGGGDDGKGGNDDGQGGNDDSQGGNDNGQGGNDDSQGGNDGSQGGNDNSQGGNDGSQGGTTPPSDGGTTPPGGGGKCKQNQDGNSQGCGNGNGNSQ